MTWYLSARRVSLIASVQGIVLLLIALLGAAILPVPGLTGVGGGVPFALLAPTVLVGLALVSVGDQQTGPERVAVRRLSWWDLALLLMSGILPAVLLSIVGTTLLVAGNGGGELLLAAARNTLGYLGIGLLVWSVGARMFASTVPFLVSVLAAAAGVQYRHVSWAWPVNPDVTTTSAVSAGVMLALGLITAMWASSRRRRR